MNEINQIEKNKFCTKNAIEVSNLCKVIKGKNILNNVSFNIPEGSIAIFAGDNGAGKTTTIKCLMDLYHFNSGKIKIFGIDSHNPTARENVGYVPEKENFAKSKLKQFFYRMGDLLNLSKIEINDKLSYFSSIFELQDILNSSTNIKKMSSGQKKKILIVNAFLANSKLFIMDEPTDNLDPKVRFKFYDLITELNKKYNTTFLICSHNLDEVGEHANYGVFIDHGKILYSGKINSKQELVEKYKSLFNLTKKPIV